MTVRLRDVLDLPVVRAGGPRVLTGPVDDAVRWVHTTELADIAPLLRAGDLVLTTGIALPGDDADLEAFATSLSDSGAAGLVVEFGRRWSGTLPDCLVERCERLGLPLVTLAREVRFAAIAQAAGELVVDDHLRELRESARIHETFTDLSLTGAEPGAILDAVRRLAGTAVALESLHHRVLDFREGPGAIDEFLEDWDIRSRSVDLTGRTVWDAQNGWLVTRVGGQTSWGRLVLECPDRPSSRLTVVAERAAAAITLYRLHHRHLEGVLRRTHLNLLHALLAGEPSEDVVRRCDLAGVPVDRGPLVGAALRPSAAGQDPTPEARAAVVAEDDVVAALLAACAAERVPALVAAIDHDVRALLAPPRSADVDGTLERVAGRVHARCACTLAVGRTVVRTDDADRTLQEAQHVLNSVRNPSEREIHRLQDTHLRGLLSLLEDDTRLTSFARTELGPLRLAPGGEALLAAVAALVEHPTSKAAAAASLHISRPAFYERIAKAERVLGADLDDAEVRASLHVAMLTERRRVDRDRATGSVS